MSRGIHRKINISVFIRNGVIRYGLSLEYGTLLLVLSHRNELIRYTEKIMLSVIDTLIVTQEVIQCIALSQLI